ncbi:MAG: DUF4358 domain-containing protein [Oscillospiraceae bacterium]|nr:DUF4358 domain-containing protein [Oscillospiraceae bacterium]
MKRKIAWLLALVCLLTAFTGCGGKKELEPRAFVDELLSGAKFTDSLNQLDDPVVPLLYGVDAADYTSAIVYCGTAATAEEIAVFTAKDDAAADRLLTAARARVDDQIESYKSYGPAAAMTLENAIVKKSGNHVVVVICTDAQGAAKIADKYM